MFYYLCLNASILEIHYYHLSALVEMGGSGMLSYGDENTKQNTYFHNILV